MDKKDFHWLFKLDKFLHSASMLWISLVLVFQGIIYYELDKDIKTVQSIEKKQPFILFESLSLVLEISKGFHRATERGHYAQKKVST